MVFKRTPRGTTILLLASALVTLGLVEINGSGLALVYAGVGLFLYYYTARLVLQLQMVSVNRLEVLREHSNRISETDTMNVSLTIKNSTFLGVRTELLDSYPNYFKLKTGSNSVIVGVPGHGQSILEYDVEPTSIGKNDFGKVHLTTRDLAGLLFYERDIPLSSTVEVIPQAREAVRGSLTAIAVSDYAGPQTSKKKGEGMEFTDIREYTYGDPYKRIEWKSTARTRQLMVRELYAETPLNVMILLDAAPSMAYGERGKTKLDYSARAVVSLVAYLSRRGDFFGFTLVQGNGPAKVLPIARAQLQIGRIFLELGRLAPNPTNKGRLDQGVRRAVQLGRLKSRTLFFVVSDLETRGDLAALRQLVAMNHEVIIVSPYSPLFEAHHLKRLDRMIYSINASQQWKERSKMVHEASRLEISLLNVGPKDLFPQLVARVEEQRRRGGS